MSFSCLAAILMVGDASREVLMVINNYTGDRLNFGLAIEMAINVHNHRNVKLLIVDDDCSIDNPRNSTGRRGLAGISFINKIAGAMSSKDFKLNEIHELCSDILRNRLIRTIGFSFHHDESNELADIEIGYGIHGEPGSRKLAKAKNFKPIIRILMEKLRLDDVESDAVILFNNLGGASEFIFFEFVKEFTELIKAFPLRVVKVYAGKFLTSLNKEAISVSIMELRDQRVLEFLEFSVAAPAGFLFNNPFGLSTPCLTEFHIPKTLLGASEHEEASVTRDDAIATEAAIEQACLKAIEIKAILNEMDSELGDGDTGSTISRGAEALLSSLKQQKVNVNNPKELLLQISSILMNSMGGTSGAIFSIFFQCSSKAFTDSNEHSINNWMNGLLLGMQGIMSHGKSEISDRTLLDSLNAGYSAVKGRGDLVTTAIEMLETFSGGCKNGADATKTMCPKSGRSSYSFSDKGNEYEFKSSIADPGAYAVAMMSDAIFKSFSKRL